LLHWRTHKFSHSWSTLLYEVDSTDCVNNLMYLRVGNHHYIFDKSNWSPFLQFISFKTIIFWIDFLFWCYLFLHFLVYWLLTWVSRYFSFVILIFLTFSCLFNIFSYLDECWFFNKAMPFTKCLACNDQKRSKNDKFFPIEDTSNLLMINNLRKNNPKKRKLEELNHIPSQSKICKNCYQLSNQSKIKIPGGWWSRFT